MQETSEEAVPMVEVLESASKLTEPQFPGKPQYRGLTHSDILEHVRGMCACVWRGSSCVNLSPY